MPSASVAANKARCPSLLDAGIHTVPVKIHELTFSFVLITPPGIHYGRLMTNRFLVNRIHQFTHKTTGQFVIGTICKSVLNERLPMCLLKNGDVVLAFQFSDLLAQLHTDAENFKKTIIQIAYFQSNIINLRRNVYRNEV